VNGDGYDDFVVTGSSSYSYVVFGRPGLATVELSDLGTSGNTQGFRIKGIGVSDSGIAATINGRGDFNGDGLADLAVTPQSGDYDRYVIYGKTSNSDVIITGGAISATDGFSVAVSGGVVSGASPLTFLGDVNGDGFDDLGQSVTNSNTSGTRINYAVIYGTSSGSNLSIPWQLNGGTFAGGETIQADGQFNVSGGHFGLGGAGGDINGDGYADVVVRSENWDSSGGVVNVFFGGRGSLGNQAGLTTTGNGRGYVITGFNARNDNAHMETPQDVNGDGLDDVTVQFNENNTGYNTYVFFGKTDDVSFSRTELTAGTSARGFIIDGLARSIGDFNGDGLADFLTNPVSTTNVNGVAAGARWVIYGKTSASRVVLTNLQASEGFRIDGLDASATINAFSAAGDINGDGFADVLLSTSAGDPPGRTDGGITYVVYGGVSDLNSQVFQASAGDRIGTSAAEALSGHSGNNQIVGGDGNDTIQGLGGFDVLYGGNGNDRVEINASNIIAFTAAADRLSTLAARIDGGGGIDTLVVDAGAFLSVAEVAGRLHAIESIERIELVGSTLQVENGQSLTINEITGPFNRFNTGNGWTLSGSVTGFDGSVDYHQLLVDGGSDSLLRLGTSFVKASGSLAYAGGALGSAGSFDVYLNVATRTQLIVRQGIPVQGVISAPTLSIPEASSTLSFGALTLAEANDSGSGLFASTGTGTPVVVGLAGTGAAAGQKIRLIWDGQSIDYPLNSSDITAGEVRVTVPASALTAATPAGTIETLLASVQILDGAKSMVAPTVSTVLVDFRSATAPLTAPVINTSNAAASDLAGIAEARTAGTSATVDNALYVSEAGDGTVVRVFLKTAAAAGDWIRINWGDQPFTYKLPAAVTVGYFVDVQVPSSVIRTQPFGAVEVSVQQFGANGVAGTGDPTIAAAQKVSVSYAFDMPLALPASSSSPMYGFAVNGALAGDWAAYDVWGLGDINGDGLSDLAVSAPGYDVGSNTNAGAVYVLFGKTGLQTIELSALENGTSSQGYLIRGLSTNYHHGFSVAGLGDVNGDGIGDLAIGTNQDTPFHVGGYIGSTILTSAPQASYVVFGKKTDTAVVNLSNLGSGGFKVDTPDTTTTGVDIAPAGDVNADGLADVIIAKYGTPSGAADWGGAYVVYGRSGTSDIPLTLTSIAASDGFMIQGDASLGPRNALMSNMVGGGADVNGDGYDDVVMSYFSRATEKMYYSVVFGGPTSSNGKISISSLTQAGNSRGFVIEGFNSYLGLQPGNFSIIGDVNGDGLADILIGEGEIINFPFSSYVVFGRTGSTGTTPLKLTDLPAAGQGFKITGSRGEEAARIGDMNGDGLADFLLASETANSPLGQSAAGMGYVVFGRTGTTDLNITNLAASEGFRVLGETANDRAFTSAAPAGDVNGDGFADLIVGSGLADPLGRTNAGKAYVIFGGFSEVTGRIFQAANGDLIGTSAAETLTGTSGANQLVAGDGNDTLISGGGSDVLYGGSGDDTLVINASTITALATNSGNSSQAIARLDGGTGIDTVKLDGAGLTLDLTATRTPAIIETEKIDITTSNAASGNSLVMGLFDVINLGTLPNRFNTGNSWTASSTGGASGWGATNPFKQVVIDGSASDSLTINSSFYSLGTVVNGGNTYDVLQHSSSQAQILVDSDMTLTVRPSVVVGASPELGGGLTAAERDSGGGTVVRVAFGDTGAVAGNAIRLNWGSQAVTSSALTSTDIANGYVDILVPTSALSAVTASGASGTVTVSADVMSAATAGTVRFTSDPVPVSVNFIVPNAPIISSTAWSSSGTSDSSGIPEAKYALDWTTGAIPTSGTADNTLFNSEVAVNGTKVRVQLPTASAGATVPTQVGDTVQLNWGSQTITSAALTTSDVNTNRYVDITVPAATLNALGYGAVAVTARVVSASSGNLSAASGSVTVNYAFDLPLNLPGNQATPTYGFSINGNNFLNSAGQGSGAGTVSNLGDVNGDGYDDLLIGAAFDTATANGTAVGAAYVVYGGSQMATVELSALQGVATTGGFKINAGTGVERTTYYGLAGDLDYNGDGLPDYIVENQATGSSTAGRVYVVYGQTTPQAVQLSAIDAGTNASLGFSVLKQNSLGATSGGIAYNRGSGSDTTTGGPFGVNDIGDLNGDGLEDLAIGQALANGGSTSSLSEPGRVVVLYGSTTARANLTLPDFTNTSVAGGFILQGNSTMGPWLGTTVAGDGDVNGDGFSDLLVTTTNTSTTATGGASPLGTGYVLYGASNLASLSVTEFNAAGFTKGFKVDNIGQAGVFQVYLAAAMEFVGDVNGDGLDDIGIPSITEANIIYGRSSGGTVDAAQIGTAGNTQGFSITGLGGIAAQVIKTRVVGIGDFNGDGLDDMLATAYAIGAYGSTAPNPFIWVVYGQTAYGTVNVSNLQASEGFQIKPFNIGQAVGGMAFSVTDVDAAGDINGDGFADLVIGIGDDEASGRVANSGKTYVIYGGVSDLQSMTFQSANGDLIGTTASESLVGTAGANQIVAGDGNDTITGNGGADVLYGGRGNDVLVANADTLSRLDDTVGNDRQAIARLNGGNGIDTLKFDGAGLDLNLSAARRSSMESIEQFDLTGSGSNTLRLRLMDVLNFGDNNIWNAANTNGVSGEALAVTEPRRQLRVQGDAGDQVILADLASWTKTSNDMVADGANYGVWNHNTALAQLLIDTRVIVA